MPHVSRSENASFENGGKYCESHIVNNNDGIIGFHWANKIWIEENNVKMMKSSTIWITLNEKVYFFT